MQSNSNLARAWLVGLAVVALALPALGPAAASQAPPDDQMAGLVTWLREQAERRDVQLPDLAQADATLVTVDEQGHATAAAAPAIDALRAAVDALGEERLAGLLQPSDALASVPRTAVGNNVHGYLNLRFFDCSAKTDYYRVKSSVPVHVPGGSAPDPLYPVLPFAQATVWGGTTMHVLGGGWLLGLHLMAGSPFDVNVHTTGDARLVSTDAALALDGSFDALGVTQFSMGTISVKFWGFCLFSLDYGVLLQNGAFADDGLLLPPSLPA